MCSAAFQPQPPVKCSVAVASLEAMGRTPAPKATIVKKEPNVPATSSDRGDVSNMLTQLKKSSDPAKQEVLNHYNSLSRYDKQKKELLGLWKGDKSCKWFAGWKKSVTFTEQEKVEARAGFGTRSLGF